MSRRKYGRCKTLDSWDKFRRQRNPIAKIRKKSGRNYLARKCEGSRNSFWKIVKLLTKVDCANNIVICDNDLTV